MNLIASVRALFVATFALISLPAPLLAQVRPKLLVILTVDQMRADYVDRYGHTWTKGLNRLVGNGARFTNAAFPYLNTVTCAGHATIGTARTPQRTGSCSTSGSTGPRERPPPAPATPHRRS